MKLISLVDEHFAHSKNGYSGDFYPSKKMIWSRTYPYQSNITVFTGSSIHKVQNISNKINIAWIIEPYEICPYPYNVLLKNYNHFNLILSHDKEFLKHIPNGCFITYGDCWIKEEDCKIYEKTKTSSIFCSNKQMTNQHILRHKCLQISGIDKFGFMNTINYKLDGLKDYKFHIVVENSIRDDWFTEKLLDCFATGTVPIYCGTKNIGKYFDLSGMIRFDKIEDLELIINDIENNCIQYKDFIIGIKNNFELFTNYTVKENILLKIIEEKGLL